MKDKILLFIGLFIVCLFIVGSNVSVSTKSYVFFQFLGFVFLLLFVINKYKKEEKN